MKNIISSLALLITCCMISYAHGAYPFKVEISGKGKQAIIFIPGLGCSGDVWKETRAAYENNFRCYTITLAGFAGVPASGEPTLADREKGIADYIRDNKLGKAIIVGHSVGGCLALALAADHSDMIDKAVVVDALPCLPALMDPTFKVKEQNDCSAMLSKIGGMTDEQFYKMQTIGIPNMLADTSKREMVVQWSAHSDRGTFAKMYCDLSNTDLREKMANIKCPVLILLEPNFANIKQALNEQYKNLRNADLRYATKGLHFIMYDDTEWYNTQLKSFIAQ